jgi:hypothetical protein
MHELARVFAVQITQVALAFKTASGDCYGPAELSERIDELAVCTTDVEHASRLASTQGT